jgi:hypothetical protein
MAPGQDVQHHLTVARHRQDHITHRRGTIRWDAIARPALPETVHHLTCPS